MMKSRQYHLVSYSTEVIWSIASIEAGGSYILLPLRDMYHRQSFNIPQYENYLLTGQSLFSTEIPFRLSKICIKF